MSRPERAGTFKAHAIEWGLRTHTNGSAIFDISFFLDEWEGEGGEWFDYTSYNATITGYFYLEKRDGTINETAINQLKDALGWDGLDLRQLQAGDWKDIPVQVVLDYETFEGKERLKLQWLNNIEGGAGPITQASAADLTALQNRTGAQLRALGGPVPQEAAKPTKRPPPPPVKVGHTPVDEKDIPF